MDNSSRHIILTTFAAILSLLSASAIRPDSLLLERMFNYAATVSGDTINAGKSLNYTRFALNIERKNLTLLAVPTMFAVANGGQRHYIDESYNELSGYGTDDMDSRTLLRTTTIPHRSKAMENMLKYLTPKIYQETIIDDYLISPFTRQNKKFYKYSVTFNLDGTVTIKFHPRRNNTQLLTGQAMIDYTSGRVMDCEIQGEYDMVDFNLKMLMGDSGQLSLLPTQGNLSTSFKFLGNKITGKYASFYNLPQPANDTISGNDAARMASLRPDTLTTEEARIVQKFQRDRNSNDTTRHHKKNKLWEIIGDHAVNRIKSNFGNDNQGYVRINPILNPLYLGYSHRKGVTYKFDVRASYMFSPKNELSGRVKAGYSFKQKQLYMRIPITWYFDKSRDGFIRAEFGNDNQTANAMITKHIEEIFPDSIYDWRNNDIGNFNNNYMKVFANIDLSPYFSIQGGLSHHMRKAVNVDAYKKVGQRHTYRSGAPIAELQWRPWAWKGPVFTVDYERSIKGLLNSNTKYERWEMNGEYIYRQSRLQNLHMRIGGGFYTLKDKNAYFCDYENFRENTLPGGWNDDWSGEFELLRRDTYNQSDYYVRANVTYESPLLLLSWVPWFGKYMEMERIHVSTLDVKNIHPYIEAGYGFTTRLFSFGFFASFKQWKYDAVGVKWGFELFRKW